MLRLLGGVVRAFGHALPFGRELQPGFTILVAQRARLGRGTPPPVSVGFTFWHVPHRSQHY
jgi:hypothetical protein